MKIKIRLILYFIAAFLLVCPQLNYAQDLKPVKLPAPQLESGKPLMQALKARKSSRAFSAKELPLQVLSDLLWAADGISRPNSGLRTAPSAMDMQEIDIYLAKADGLYLFDPQKNMLIPVIAEDIRGLTGGQEFVKEAPLNLIYVADLSKMSRLSESEAESYAGMDTGFISENAYLYCASAGLATVVRGSIDRVGLAKAMKLRADQKIILAQTVGYPKE